MGGLKFRWRHWWELGSSLKLHWNLSRKVRKVMILLPKLCHFCIRMKLIIIMRLSSLSWVYTSDFQPPIPYTFPTPIRPRNWGVMLWRIYRGWSCFGGYYDSEMGSLGPPYYTPPTNANLGPLFKVLTLHASALVTDYEKRHDFGRSMIILQTLQLML